jgi:adiponectin receptor
MEQTNDFCGNCNTLTKKQLLKQHAWAHVCTYKYIDNHYRKPCACVRHCLSTAFSLHNETTNIWTHGLGVLLFGGLLAKMICETENRWNIAIWLVYFLSAIAVCFCSTTYHLFACHSKKICEQARCVDWLMISTLIFSSNLLASYFELFCISSTIFFAFNFVNFVLMIITAHNTYYGITSAKSYLFNATTYILYALGVAIVLLIKWFVDGMVCIPETWKMICLMYLCYGTVLCNIFYLPERIMPKNICIELFGYSHNIFHIGVIVGVIVLWKTYA